MIVTCAGTTRAGKPCRFTARRETGLCVNHDPTYRDEQRFNVRTGGAKSGEARRSIHLDISALDLSDPAAISALLQVLLQLEFKARIAPSRARGILRAVEAAIENRRGW
jgi:hypothetical protein